MTKRGMKYREKIAEIIKKNGTYNGRSLSFDYHVVQPDDLATALIENDIGDIIEWKRRAEVAERNDKLKEKALNNACAMLYAQGVESPFSDEDWHLRQAEKELQKGM